MIDIDILRNNPERLTEVCEQKKIAVDILKLQKLDEEKRTWQSKLDDIYRQRNELAAAVTGGRPTKEQINQGRELKETAATIEEQLNKTLADFMLLWKQVPNFPSDDTPIGPDESGNQVLRQVGKPRQFNFAPRPHWELGEMLNIIDTESAAELAGSRFAYLKNELALLQFALLQFGFSVLTSTEKIQEIITQARLDVPAKPFVPIVPPVFIRPEMMEAMARLEPREERYYIPSDDLFLIGSAEHALGTMHANQSIDEAKLPLRYVGYSTSFRREAGSHGKDVRGILRLHQFDKLEMEIFSTPETSQAEQDLIVAIQEYLMQTLGLPYQVVICCTGDMGGPDARHIDIETWMPGQDKYRETHSADLMTDYQARRLGTRVKSQTSTRLLHMNDATAFAIGRTLVAIMENYQEEDGSITVPEVLRPWVNFEAILPA